MSGARNPKAWAAHLMAALAAGVLMTAVLASPAQAAPFAVTNTADSGEGSLRQAISDANGSVGGDKINFDPALSGQTITLASRLPAITDGAGLTIDGASSSITVDGNNAVRVLEVGSGAKLTLTKLTVANGRSSPSCSSCDYFGSGGGIYNAGVLTVSNSTLSGNRASATDSSSGGGIYNTDSGTLTVSNSTLSGNGSRCAGGGIYNAGTATVSNSTLSGNYAVICEGGGGISNSGPKSTATLKNTIVADSSLGGDCAGTITDGGHNLGSGTSCGFAAANDSLSGEDPLLDPNGLQDNGGPTKTIALQPGSPAIDKGDSFGATADQRGVARPQGAASDIGAFEVDVTKPKVRTATPTGKGIARGANVAATFSEAMDAATIDGTTFQLFKKGTTTAIGAAVAYDPATKKAVLNPNANLRRGAQYKAVITTGAEDLAGNALDQDPTTAGDQQKTWTFTTKR